MCIDVITEEIYIYFDSGHTKSEVMQKGHIIIRNQVYTGKVLPMQILY